jgi:hypothetical protein
MPGDDGGHRDHQRHIDRLPRAPRGGCARSSASPLVQAERPVEDRRHDAAERQRGVEAGRQRPERARAHREHLLQGRVRLHRSHRPARTLPRLGSLHAAQARDRRRPDRHARTARARRRVLHDAGAHRRRTADHRAAARHRRHLVGVRPRRRRHHRPPEHPAALDPRRGRPRDLATTRGCGPRHHRGVRRCPPRDPRLPRRRHLGRRADRSDPADQRDHLAVPGRRVAGEPPPQVQVGHHRAPEPGRRPRDQRRGLRRRRAPRARHRLRPVGRRRPLGLAAARRAPGGLRRPRAGGRGLARGGADLPRLRLPAAAQQGASEVPARRVGPREVPAGAAGRVPRLRAPRRSARPEAPDPGGPRRRAPPEGRPLLRRCHADRRPRLGSDPRRPRRPHRGARFDPPPHDAPPEDRHPRHPRGPRRIPHRRTRRARAVGAAEPHPPRHHRVHGHRVLQARDRRDQGLRHRRRPRPREAPRAVRAAASDLAARERLPELVRPHPDRRHRPQGTARHDRRRAGSRLPGAPGGGLASQDRDEAGLGRTVRGLKVAADGIADYVDRVVRRFLDERDSGIDETFAQWAHRADEEALV